MLKIASPIVERTGNGRVGQVVESDAEMGMMLGEVEDEREVAGFKVEIEGEMVERRAGPRPRAG